MEKRWVVAFVVYLAGCGSETRSEPVTCAFGGAVYSVGDRYYDGCNWCTCTDFDGRGGAVCNGRACPDSALDTRVDTAVDTGLDAIDATTDATADATVDTPAEAALCDDKTCGINQVCVVPCCAPPCKPARPFCADVPSGCGGTPGCACMASACAGGSSCGGMIDGRLQCACF
ncbi:MAG: hypothetical protein JNL79_40245 [Myxococcales bacterium]|nr:hypothetical protein [Myxococcales bacterium]